MLRTVAASETLGVRALLVHAIDADARAFYLRHGLESSSTDRRHLMILTKDIAAAVDTAGSNRAAVVASPPIRTERALRSGVKMHAIARERSFRQGDRLE